MEEAPCIIKLSCSSAANHGCADDNNRERAPATSRQKTQFLASKVVQQQHLRRKKGQDRVYQEIPEIYGLFLKKLAKEVGLDLWPDNTALTTGIYCHYRPSGVLKG